jgi:hypothetical protein
LVAQTRPGKAFRRKRRGLCVLAMSDGFMVASFLQPEVYTCDLIVAAFEALA